MKNKVISCNYPSLSFMIKIVASKFFFFSEILLYSYKQEKGMKIR